MVFCCMLKQKIFITKPCKKEGEIWIAFYHGLEAKRHCERL